ncbi:MAG: hypothetical protein OJF49_001175 [Ktedonobacterales bacterium]|jgi:outer membrane protein assembly factor BamB|nr:MAG: hypothetical protein OJF49_001175 [Ktedonobacterales bacterium]
MSGKVFISHAREDFARCARLLKALDTWGVDYWYETMEHAAGQRLTEQAQMALSECDVFLRICTRDTKRSYWMGIEAGSFLSLQAEDHRKGQVDRRKLVNLVLDPAYVREPFDASATVIDATNTGWAGWVNELRRALSLPPLVDIVAVAQEINPPQPEGISRRKAIGLAAAGAVVLAAAGAGGLALLKHGGTTTAIHTPTATPTPPSSDPHLRWWYQTPSHASVTKFANAIDSSLAVANGVIYTATEDGGVYALSAIGLQLLWSKPLGISVSATPLAVYNNLVYVRVNGGDYTLYALDAQHEGNEVWHLNYTATGPAIVDGVLYAGGNGLAGAVINGFDPMTGKSLWGGATNGYPSGTPAVANGIVYIGTDKGYVHAFSITTPHSEIWSAKAGADAIAQGKDGAIVNLPAIANGIVYIGSEDHNLYALDALTGAQRWKYPTGDEIFYSSPAVANGMVYVGSEDHMIYALDAKTGTKVWSYETKGKVASSPAVVGAMLYIGSSDRSVYVLDAKTGSLLHKYAVSGSVVVQPMVVNGILYAGDANGIVYAFDAAQ